jgi:hypothetical protein
MKKSVVILIVLIYIVAVAIVSFFGLKIKVFEPIVYVESIEILNQDIKQNSMGMKYVMLELDENGEATYQIHYRVHPDEATDQGVIFSYDKQNEFVTIDDLGYVKFTDQGAVTVTLLPKDGTVLDEKPQVMIVAMRPQPSGTN